MQKANEIGARSSSGNHCDSRCDHDPGVRKREHTMNARKKTASKRRVVSFWNMGSSDHSRETSTSIGIDVF
jgi:hypothetical protein